MLRLIALLALLILPGCSDDSSSPPGDIGPDVATTAYCLVLRNKCKAGDASACAEEKAKCPYTAQYDSGIPDSGSGSQ